MTFKLIPRLTVAPKSDYPDTTYLLEYVGHDGIEDVELQLTPLTHTKFHVRDDFAMEAAIAHAILPNTFQERVHEWMLKIVDLPRAMDRKERMQRLLEEVLELAQCEGLTGEDVRELMSYTFSRPVGERRQEMGGVLVCLAAYCNALDFNMHDLGEEGLSYCHENTDRIRRKTATAQPDKSPLPGQDPDLDEVYGTDKDPLYPHAVRIVTVDRKASISRVQRGLKIGYNRAARLIEQMETKGIIGPLQSNGSREVLAPDPISGISHE